MGDDYSVFGQLSQMTPSGKTRDPKDVPIGKGFPRRKREKKKDPPLASPREKEKDGDAGEEKSENPPSGKLLDIIV
ncbi:MAG: hypothetical protein FJ117_17675 [Deltaproteobacteria bacterium]|nr:hypothetical protein [Deltaproteobacteria bacterium]